MKKLYQIISEFFIVKWLTLAGIKLFFIGIFSWCPIFLNVSKIVTEQEPPKIEFPCDYPIKVMGNACPEFQALVMEVMERHAPGFDQSAVSSRGSSKGTFEAITVVVTATGVDQLQAIFDDLKNNHLVKMVL